MLVPNDSISDNKPSNVLKFPEKKFNAASKKSLEELQEEVKNNKIEFADYVTSELIEDLFLKITVMGFEISHDRFAKDTVMVMESLKSLILKTMNIDHSMQMAAEKLIILDENEAIEDKEVD